MGFVAAALKLDPNYAIAHAYMALGHENCFLRGGFDEADRVAGVRHARLALSQGSDDPMALSMAGFVMMMLGHDAAAASASIARALALNASCTFALYHGALVHAYSGTTALAEEYANRALRLSPFDPQSYLAYLALGAVHFRERRYDEAALLLGKAAQANPGFSIGHARLAAALAMAGRTAEAKAAASQTLELDPGFRIGRLTSALRFMPPELLEGYAEGGRRAGLPD
jgi:tetratricopeptide (TPR) repeat protein